MATETSDTWHPPLTAPAIKGVFGLTAVRGLLDGRPATKAARHSASGGGGFS
jgi:hypothetical protein